MTTIMLTMRGGKCQFRHLDLLEEVTFEWNPDISKGAGHVDIRKRAGM